MLSPCATIPRLAAAARLAFGLWRSVAINQIHRDDTAMTISGELTRWQAASRRPVAGFVCLAWCGGGAWAFHTAVSRHLAPLDPALIGLIAFFPVFGLLTFWAATRRDGWRAVEFSCDESSFQFRKVRSAQPETRALSELVKVREVSGGRSSDPIGYEVVFRDGQKVFLECRLPNAKAAADWLGSHSRS